MLKALRDFIQIKNPTKLQALSIMRFLFASMFLAQTMIAFLLAFTLFLFTQRQSSSALVSQILVLFVLFQIPVGVTLPMFAARHGGKGAALTGTLMSAVLLSSPAWFTAFAFLIGAESLYLAFMFLLLMLCYSIGFVLCNRYANLALFEPKDTVPKDTVPKDKDDQIVNPEERLDL